MVMILTVTWKYFFPEDFRSSVRYAQSWSKKINTKKDRGSLNNETDAATTYAAVLKDVSVLYLKNGENLDVVEKGLARGTIVRVVSHKDEVFIYDGQGLIQIQLAKEDGSFIHGSKYWIEAEYVQIASPRDIVAKDDGLLPGRIKRENRSELTSMVKDSVFTKGVYYINVNKETPFYINIASTQNCAKYSLASQTGNGYYVIYDDGSFVYDKPGIFVEFPYKQRPRFKLKSENSPETIVRMIVS
jgi:hypothetical protein